MDRLAFDRMLKLEQHHWWFEARRSMAMAVMGTIGLKPDSRILDAGCGSGGNLPMLSKYGKVYAFELDDDARIQAKSRNIGTIEAGSLPDAIPFEDTKFDLVVMTDVLEHIKDDSAALKALHGRITDEGYMLIMVPMFQSLWTSHDNIHHHFRRYSKRELFEKTRGAGFEVVFSSYSYLALFPCLIAAYLLEKLGINSARTLGAKMPAKFINQTLISFFSLESKFMARRLALPIGISHVLLLKKSS